MINKKIVICSTIRNVEKDLKKFFKKIDEITHNFNEYFIIMVQSNSQDSTVEIANKYLSIRKGKLINRAYEKVRFSVFITKKSAPLFKRLPL